MKIKRNKMFRRDKAIEKTFRRSLTIERNEIGPKGYCEKERSCEVSFASETDDVIRFADTNLSRALKSSQYKEVLDTDHFDFDFLRSGGSCLKNHDPNQIIGALVNPQITADYRATAKIVFTSTQGGKDAETEVREGALKSTSFGYEHDSRFMKVVPKGERTIHHGKQIDGPALIVGVRALEVTLTPIPADSTTGVGRSKILERENTGMDIKKYMRNRAFKANLGLTAIRAIEAVLTEDSDEAEVDGLIAAATRDLAATATATSNTLKPEVIAFNAADFLSRAKIAGLDLEEIETITKSAKTDAEATASMQTVLTNRAKPLGVANRGGVELGAEASEKAIKFVEYSLARAFEPEVYNNAPSKGIDKSGNRYNDGVATGFKQVMLRGADGKEQVVTLNDLGEQDNDGVPDAFKEHVRSFRSSEEPAQGFEEIARIYLQGLGIDTRTLRNRNDTIKHLFSPQVRFLCEQRAFSPGGMFKRDGVAAANTTANFPNLFANVQNKMLRRLIARVNPTWKNIAVPSSTPDFKQFSRIALSDAGDLIQTRENQQPYQSSLSDEAETATLKKFSRRYSLTYEALLADDIGGLARVMMNINRAVLRLPDNVFWSYILNNGVMGDNVAIFDDTTHMNNNTGAPSAMAPAGANTAITRMRKQVGKPAPLDSAVPIGGMPDFLNIKPKVWAVSPDLALATSKLLYPNLYPSDSTGAQAGANYFTGGVPGYDAYQMVIEPRISSTVFNANALTTLWYLFADPSEFPSVEMVFLNGSQTPLMNTHMDVQNFGWETTVQLACAPIATEWRGMQRNAGA